MSLPRTRNALAEKIALWEERNQRMAAQLAAARPRSNQPRQTVADMRMGMGSVIARPVTGRPAPDEPSHNNTEDEKEREKHARERLRKEEEEEKARMDEEVKKELERMERELEGHRQQQDQERMRKQAEKLERDTQREVAAREREEKECKAKEQQQQQEQRRKEEEEAKQRQALKSEKELELESRRLEDERLHKERLQREEKARVWRLREENKAAVKIQARWKASHEKRKFQVMRTYRASLRRSSFGSLNSPARSATTGKMNLYRTQVAQEILSTEENYVKTLREVVEVPHPSSQAGEIYILLIYLFLLTFHQHFVRPLKEAVARGKPIISNDEIKTIFSHIQIILGYNDALLEDLRKKTSSWHPYQMIGDVFLKMAAFMRVYTDYVRNFNDALAMIQVAFHHSSFYLTALTHTPVVFVSFTRSARNHQSSWPSVTTPTRR